MRTLLLLPLLPALGAFVAAPSTPVAQDPAPAQKPAADAKDFADYTATIPGSEVTFDMVAIRGGTFVMGSGAYRT
jgi:hypothetical protein